jgi:pimeloyl-ACP methyl ester carboxylesterase
VEGIGDPIALIHGGTGTAAFDWEFVLEPLSRTHTVVSMDVRGHGYSPDPDDRLGMVRAGLDTAAVMTRLGYPRFTVIGFSMGANSGIHLAITQPWRIANLITIGASVRSYPERVDEILTGPWPRDLRALEHPASRHDWQSLRSILAQDWADNVAFSTDALATIRAPVLAIHGADDVITDPEQSSRLVAAVPNARAVFVPDAGHAVQRDQPAAFVQHVSEFMGREGAGRPSVGSSRE